MSRFVRELKLWAFAALLIAIGLSLPAYVGLRSQPTADALIIAGLLAVSVDRYIKLRLRDDIARDVFFAAVGIHLPEELKAEILAIGDCKFVRRNLDLTYRISAHPSEGFVTCETEMEFEVENLTGHVQQFAQRVWVSRHTSAELEPDEPIVFIRADIGKTTVHEFRGGEIELEIDDHKRGCAMPVRIPPREKAHFWSTTRQVLPHRHEDRFTVLQPTIGVTVRIDCPDGMESGVTFDHRIGREAEPLPRNTWRLSAALLPYTSFRMSWALVEAITPAIPMAPLLHIRGSNSGTVVPVSRDG